MKTVRRRSLWGMMSVLLFSFLPLITVRGEALYVANFQVTFDSGFGGLPATTMTGTYTFAVTPPTQTYLDISWYYDNALRSGSFNLNGTVMTSDLSWAYLRVDNNISLNPTTKRDGYYSIINLSNYWGGNFFIEAAGLSFEQSAFLPAALANVDLPTRTSDLSGFAPSEQTAVLVFKNFDTGITYATYAPVSQLSIEAVPEPSAMGMILLGGAVLGCGRWQMFRAQ